MTLLRFWAAKASFLRFIGDVLQDIFHPALEDFAQGIQGGGRDGLAVLHAVQRVGCDPFLKNKMVFCDIFPVKRLIKGTVTDHVYHLE